MLLSVNAHDVWLYPQGKCSTMTNILIFIYTEVDFLLHVYEVSKPSVLIIKSWNCQII